NRMIWAAVIMLIFSWIIFFFSTHFLIGIIIGVVAVDLGQQTLHVTNQDIILRKASGTRNRLNTVYMVIFFLGGAIGTSIGALAYVKLGWQGVSLLSLLLCVIIGIIHIVMHS